MNYSSFDIADETIQFIEENDIKFIRLAFCDLFGMQKNISIMKDEFVNAIKNGIAFDASSISGFGHIKDSDLFLHPDISTFTLLPWRPQQGRVARFYCNISNTSKESYEFDSRHILKKALNETAKMGYTCMVGSECEFYLFKTDENGSPTLTPFDQAGYLDMAPLDKGENVRREICLTLEELGLHPESSHHEQGPGQNEIDFKFSDALRSADDFMTFKTAVKAIAMRNGLFASFMPKPLPNKSGSGLHINISVFKDGENIFESENKSRDSFMAGILEKAYEISLFLNPIPNSYERLGKFESPKNISCCKHDRSALIRLPAETGTRARMELRSPDAAINPYLAYALVINAGMNGIKQNLSLNTIDCKNNLPHTLKEAIEAAKNSDFVKEVLGETLVSKYIQHKEHQSTIYNNAYDKSTVNSNYFPLL